MKIPEFFTNMDKQSWRSVAVVLVMFAIVIALLLVSREMITIDGSQLGEALSHLRSSPLALPVTIAVFCAAAFIGAPQWVLIALAVTAFGPVLGGLYAWVATLCSAGLNFALANVVGAERLERAGGTLIKRIKLLVNRNGILTSFVVRLVPTGPFILVNMAAGISGMRVRDFLLGTALGIVPKILIVALLGQGALTAQQGRAAMTGFIIAAIVIVIIMLAARQYLQRFVDIDPS